MGCLRNMQTVSRESHVESEEESATMYGSAITGMRVAADDCWVSCDPWERRLEEDQASLLSLQDGIAADDCWGSCDPWERRLKV